MPLLYKMLRVILHFIIFICKFVIAYNWINILTKYIVQMTESKKPNAFADTLPIYKGF